MRLSFERTMSISIAGNEYGYAKNNPAHHQQLLVCFARQF